MDKKRIKYSVGIYLCIVSILAIYGTYWYWPQDSISIPLEVAQQNENPVDSTAIGERSSTTFKPDTSNHSGNTLNNQKTATDDPSDDIPKGRLVMLIVSVGVLGSMLHALNSFAAFIGNNKFNPSWAPWYFLRPFIGALIALIFYLVLKGGLGQSSNDSLGWILAACALAGMFSDKATTKLKEIFDAIFPTNDEKEDKLKNNA